MKPLRLRALAQHFVIENTEFVRAIYQPGRTKTLVVTFGGIGKDYTVPPPMEFLGTASRNGENHVLAINDLRRSWYSLPEVVEGVRRAYGKVADAMAPTISYGIGNSMGGYAAVLFAPEMRFDVTVALCPQYSMQPDVVRETRWGELRAGFGSDLAESLAESLDEAPGTTWILHGMMGPDIRHYELILPSSRLHHGLVSGQSHDVASFLKVRNVLTPFIHAALDENEAEAKAALQDVAMVWRVPGQADDIGAIRKMRNDIQAARDARKARRKATTEGARND